MSKALTCALLLLLCSFATHAGIYRWVDEYGKSHFTDKPPADKKTEEVELKINTYSAVKVTPLVERLGRDNKVVIYTTSWCRICKQAKKHFRKNNIAYVAYDVEKSRTGKRDYKLLRGKAVPIIIVGDKRMNGFTAPRFDRLYKKQMQKKAENQGENGSEHSGITTRGETDDTQKSTAGF